MVMTLVTSYKIKIGCTRLSKIIYHRLMSKILITWEWHYLQNCYIKGGQDQVIWYGVGTWNGAKEGCHRVWTQWHCVQNQAVACFHSNKMVLALVSHDNENGGYTSCSEKLVDFYES